MISRAIIYSVEAFIVFKNMELAYLYPFVALSPQFSSLQ